MAKQTEDQLRLAAWNATQRELRPGETILDRMRFLRALSKARWRVVFTRDSNQEIVVGVILRDVPAHATGTAAARIATAEWEQRSAAMHAAQKTVTIPDKPAHGGTRGRQDAVAALQVVYADKPIENFADTPAATGFNRTTERA